MNRPFRILHVITGLKGGGAERMLCRLLQEGARNGLEEAVLPLRPGGEVAPLLAQFGFPVIGLPEGWPWPGGPDLIMGWMYHGALAAALLQRTWAPACPLVWNLRSTLEPLSHFKPATRGVVRTCRALSGWPDRILYNAEEGRLQHESFGFLGGGGVIPNGFDLERFRPDPDARREVRAALGIQDGEVLFGLVARLHPMKDHATFLQALARLAREGRPVKAVLVGAGVASDAPSLAPFLETPSLGGRVHCLGSREDLPRLTAALDVAVSSSSGGEGFSNALGEALACGVPCVATQIGDAGRILEGVGHCVPASDPEALAGAMRQVLEAGAEARERLGAQGRARVAARWSLKAIGRQYADLYAGLVRNGRA